MSEEFSELDEVKVEPIKNESDFDERLRKLAKLTEVAKDQSEILKEVESEKEALSYQLAQYMLSSGCQSKILDGVKFTQKQRVFSKVEDKEALRQWVLENDAVDLLMTVHPSKLTAYCNEQLEQGGSTPTGVNPNFIKYFVHVK